MGDAPRIPHPAARLHDVEGFDIDAVARGADRSPGTLRLENLDTDLAPPPQAIEATVAAVGRDDANSYLPFTGLPELRRAVADRIGAETHSSLDPDRNVVISSGGLAGLLSVLLAVVDPGDEVVVTDPSYAGILARVRLAGAMPHQVPLVVEAGHWRLDLDALEAAFTARTKAVALCDPSMPTGLVLNDEEWAHVSDLTDRHDVLLIHDAAFQRVRFDGKPPINPAAIDRLRGRTITIGSVSKELRMIGWRVGWVVGPESLLEGIAKTVIYNTVVPSGFAQAGAVAALRTSDDGVGAAVIEWQRRRDAVESQLEGLPYVAADGAWSLLLDAEAAGTTAPALSRALLREGVAATPMTAWGERVAPRHVRFVFANEPVERLATLRSRLDAALAQVGVSQSSSPAKDAP